MNDWTKCVIVHLRHISQSYQVSLRRQWVFYSKERGEFFVCLKCWFKWANASRQCKHELNWKLCFLCISCGEKRELDFSGGYWNLLLQGPETESRWLNAASSTMQSCDWSKADLYLKARLALFWKNTRDLVLAVFGTWAWPASHLGMQSESALSYSEITRNKSRCWNNLLQLIL